MNGKIIKYKFLFQDLAIKQAIENDFGYWYARLAPSGLTSQGDLINTKMMGKTQFYASFVNSIVAILSQSLVKQGHYNDTLPDRSNGLQKTILAGFIATLQ